MVANAWHNARPKFVIVYHSESDGSRSAHQMHLADAERVIREFPSEWSRFPSATSEPAPIAEPTALDRLGDLERSLRSLEASVTAIRRELAAQGSVKS